MNNFIKYNDNNFDLVNGNGEKNDREQNFSNAIKDLDKDVQNVAMLSQSDYNTTISRKNTLYFIDNILEEEGEGKKILDIAVYQPYSELKHPYEFWLLQLDETNPAEKKIRLLRGDSIINHYLDKEIKWNTNDTSYANFINNIKIPSSETVLRSLKEDENTRKFSKIEFYCEKEYKGYVGGSLAFDGTFEYTEDGSSAVLKTSSYPFLALIDVNGNLQLFVTPDAEPVEVRGELNRKIVSCSVEKGYGNNNYTVDQGIVIAYIERKTELNVQDAGIIKYIRYRYHETYNASLVNNGQFFSTPEKIINVTGLYPELTDEEIANGKRAIGLEVNLRRLSDYRLALTYTYATYTLENEGFSDYEYNSKVLLSDRAFIGVAARQEIVNLSNTITDFPGTATALYGAVRNKYYSDDDVNIIQPSFKRTNRDTQVQDGTHLYTDYQFQLDTERLGAFSGIEAISEVNPIISKGTSQMNLGEAVGTLTVFNPEDLNPDRANIFNFEASPMQDTDGYTYVNDVYGWGSYGCAALVGVVTEKTTNNYLTLRFRGASTKSGIPAIRTVCKIKPQYSKENSIYIRTQIDGLTAKKDTSNNAMLQSDQQLGYDNSGGWLAMTDFDEFTLGQNYVIDMRDEIQVDFSEIKYVVHDLQYLSLKLTTGSPNLVNQKISFYINLRYTYSQISDTSSVVPTLKEEQANGSTINVDFNYSGSFQTTIKVWSEINV